jgi:hypothetical protein
VSSWQLAIGNWQLAGGEVNEKNHPIRLHWIPGLRLPAGSSHQTYAFQRIFW